MTPREVLAKVEWLGFGLALRPGGLRLTGRANPPFDVLALIHEHRDGLVSLLEAEARGDAAHEASLEAGRVTPFPAHLLALVHPSIRHLVAVQEPSQKTRAERRAGLVHTLDPHDRARSPPPPHMPICPPTTL